MADSRLVLGGGNLAHSTSTSFTPLGTGFYGTVDQTVETRVQTVHRTAGTLSFLGVQCSTHTSNTVITPRKNASSTGINETVTIAGTGVTEDTTNTDAVTAGDKWDTQYSALASTFTTIAYTFAATGTTSCRLLCHTSSSTTTYNTVSQTSFNLFGSRQEVNTTEGNAQFVAEKAGNLKNLFVNIISNAGTGATAFTMSTRVGGSTGTVTTGAVATGTTGFVEDTTHSDSVSVGQDIHLQVATGAASTINFGLATFGCDFTSSNGDSIINCGDSNTLTNARNQTVFGPLGGGASGFSTTETAWQMRPRDAYVFSNLQITISGNGVANTSTANLRVGAASVGSPSTIAATIGASSNGNVIDSTNTYTASATDLMNYQFAIGVGSGSQTIVLNTIGVHINLGGAVAAAKYSKFFTVQNQAEFLPGLYPGVSNLPPMFVT